MQNKPLSHLTLTLLTATLALCVCAPQTQAETKQNTKKSQKNALQLTNPQVTTCIAPLGKYSKTYLRTVARGVTYLYGFRVKILPARAMFKKAWYPKRRRWRADIILDELDTKIYPKSGCTMVLGFTSVDISTSTDTKEDWGILGLGRVGGKVGVVSTYRTRRGLKPPHTRARRTVKVFNHEIGHILGLPHVKGEGCLMSDAEGTVLTVDKESGLLCDSTIAWIESKLGYKIPRHKTFDWSRVESKKRKKKKKKPTKKRPKIK